ncbi:unnamed protein product [Gongylonema pulchrum]|uniref:Ion_trans_2 domain-containing protein n=1 Tax=Gongylonema pulchrum TaxID=637853 RepID=A0A183DYY4_9BILA|nr:unnamed protein product [Gongylonema pulchrum]
MIITVIIVLLQLTVGFGDLVPTNAEGYVLVPILFIFAGLVLTTLAIDVIGASCITTATSLFPLHDPLAARLLSSLPHWGVRLAPQQFEH